MYVQIVTYNLNGVSEQDYIDIAHQVSPQFNSMPGLHAKVWLANAEENAFGAVYFWDDRESMERFTRSDLFEATYPGFANVVSQGYDVYEHLTKSTQPMLTILEEGWTAAPASPVEAPAPSAPPPRKATKKATPRKTAAKKVAKATKATKAAKKSGRKAAGPRKAAAKRSKKSAS